MGLRIDWEWSAVFVGGRCVQIAEDVGGVVYCALCRKEFYGSYRTASRSLENHARRSNKRCRPYGARRELLAKGWAPIREWNRTSGCPDEEVLWGLRSHYQGLVVIDEIALTTERARHGAAISWPWSMWGPGWLARVLRVCPESDGAWPKPFHPCLCAVAGFLEVNPGMQAAAEALIALGTTPEQLYRDLGVSPHARAVGQ